MAEFPKHVTVGVGLKTGLVIRQLETIERHARELREELQDIEKNSCPDCGGALEDTKDYVGAKVCTKCGEKYLLEWLQRNRQGDVGGI